jgi:uncharacterized protein (DUF342 family)
MDTPPLNPEAGAQTAPPEPQPGLLALAPQDDGQALYATYTPPGAADAPRVALQATLIQAQIAQGGWSTWWRDDAAVGKLVQQAATTKEPLSVKIAERRPGRCTVQVARDRMSATLSLEPPQGGDALTLDQVRQILSDKGVKFGLLDDVLAAAVAEGRAINLEVAKGQPAVNGEHTRFDQLVPNMQQRHPRIDDDGWVDYRDLGDLVVVKEGTPLMRRIPPTPGEEGHDVTGGVLRPKPGANKPFAPGLKGVAFDPHDADLLLAAVTGQPVVVSQGVKVDPNIVLPNVDLGSGNIKFDGLVNIKGDVKDGMKVFSSGDVMVGGAVLAGEIEAQGNVIVKGGVIGHSEYNGKDSGRNSWFSAKIVAKGTIQARYAENAYLEAEGDVVLDDYAMHSEITSLTHVTIGKPGAKKGRCIGGHTRATLSIRVAESGSSAGAKTVLQAGHNPLIEQEIAAIDARIAKHEAEVANLQKIIDFMALHPERNKDDMAGRALLTQELHQGQMLELQAEKTNLQEALHLADGAHIDVDVTVHGGTEVRLGGKVWQTADTRAHGVFRLNDEGELVFGS